MKLDLVKCVGRRSWLLFHLLEKRELDWLHASAENWENTVGYCKMEEIVRSFEVVNDCAERGIKLIADFKDATKDKEPEQYLLQVIERHRRNLPKITKENLKKV